MVYKNVVTVRRPVIIRRRRRLLICKKRWMMTRRRGSLGSFQVEQGVEKVNYLSREDALGEFRNWSGFGGALDMLEENPLPAVWRW